MLHLPFSTYLKCAHKGEGQESLYKEIVISRRFKQYFPLERLKKFTVNVKLIDDRRKT